MMGNTIQHYLEEHTVCVEHTIEISLPLNHNYYIRLVLDPATSQYFSCINNHCVLYRRSYCCFPLITFLISPQLTTIHLVTGQTSADLSEECLQFRFKVLMVPSSVVTWLQFRCLATGPHLQVFTVSHGHETVFTTVLL